MGILLREAVGLDADDNRMPIQLQYARALTVIAAKDYVHRLVDHRKGEYAPAGGAPT